jgi:CRP-like cAMP-binding protein
MMPLSTLSDLPLDFSAPAMQVGLGVPLLRRAVLKDEVLHVESGRVALGLMDGTALVHQLGVIEGPFWLDVTAAVLGLPCVVDAVTETPVVLRRIPLGRFHASLNALPRPMQTVLHDMAQAHRQQTELAVSRLAKDAEARCAEWLLRHAQPSGEPGALAVMLHQRKRLIAAQLGIAPETLSRVLRHLRERSLISGSGRVVNLVNPSGLRSLAGV